MLTTCIAYYLLRGFAFFRRTPAPPPFCEMNWTPAVSLEEGLTSTAKWVEANLELFDPDRYHL